jgi:hypothetical protein
MPATISAPAIEINAPLQVVWSILDDFDRYPEWNPFTVYVRTNRVVGQAVYLDVCMGKSFKQTQKEILKAYQPPYKLAWGGLFPRSILSATRWQELEPLDAFRTRYLTYETFTGLLEPLTMWLCGRDIEQGFIQVSQTLKHRAENLRQAQS